MELKDNKKRAMQEDFPHDLNVSHVFVSAFRNESRAIKEMRSLKKEVPEAQISFVGMKDNDQLSYELFDGSFQIFREDLKTRPLPKFKGLQVLKYMEWIWRASSRLKRLSPKIIHCHSLGALPAAVLAKNYLKCGLVYDAHELETERYHFKGLDGYISRKMERVFMKFVDEVLVVSPSIQDFYQNLYPKKRIGLLVNAPSISELHDTHGINLKEKLGLSNNDFLFACIGGLNKGRSIEIYIETFKKLEAPYHLLFLGEGFFCEDIKKLASEKQNIHWLPPVPPNQVINTLKSVNVMIRLLEISRLSYLYSLPNSIFQAEIAGIPYLVNNECIDIVKFFENSSLCIPIERNVEALYTWCKMYSSKSFPKRKGVENVLYTWESYEKILFSAYRNSLQNFD